MASAIVGTTYRKFKQGTDEEFGSFEVFEMCQADVDRGLCKQTGWYWHACFPGCLPDGSANGPFATEQEAIDDANEG